MLSLWLLSACASQHGRFPAVPQPTRVPQGDPARDAQVRLIQEAHRAFKDERYPAAALFFKRFVDIAQDSARLAEARWWLGRSYEELGDFRAAMEQYRLVAGGSLSRQTDDAFYEGEALRRLDELHSLYAAQHDRQAAQLAIRMRVDQLPPITGLSPWFQELTQTGVTAVSIAPATPGHEGFGLEMVREIAAEAHRLGLLLWVVLDLHQGQGIDVRPEWKATSRHDAGHEAAVPGRWDIANPAYQSHLEEVVRMLARAGCDGVLLAARSTAGFAEEFSDGSLRLFAASFGTVISPEEIFGTDSLPGSNGQERPANYWRWVGWKARNYGQLVLRLRKALRDHNPTATLSVEVHQSTLRAPLQGLEQFGEDMAELAPRTGGSVVVRQEGTAGEAPLEQLGRQLESTDRVWVGVTIKAATNPPSIGELKQSIDGVAELGRWNVVIEVESAQAVP